MPPRHQTLPPAQTSSAREALQSFYCQLCSKGYSRMNDYETHLSSYDHSHKQRLKDMKAMVRDPQASARARKAEAKADGIISIKLGDGAGTGSAAPGPAGGSGSGAGAGFKKGGFKKSGFKSAFAPVDAAATPAKPAEDDKLAPTRETSATTVGPTPGSRLAKAEGEESDTDDEGYEVYDPRHPTD